MLRKKIEEYISQHGYGSYGSFRLFQKVKTIYYSEEQGSDVVAHGIVIGIEYLPALTEKMGCWYKVLIYSIHKYSEEHNKMFSKLKISDDDLEEVEVIDVYSTDLSNDKSSISYDTLISKFIEMRVNELRYRLNGERLNRK
jgi:hypothetical protein